MIGSRSDLNNYLASDMPFYYEQSKKARFICWMTSDPIYYIAKYIRLLRKEEYYFNTSRRLGYLWYFRKKNHLGNKLGFKIPKNCFGPGLTIYHHGGIIVNEAASIGANCILHGDNCIGNNGSVDDNPVIGDGLDLGIGAKIIGGLKLGNNVKVGANAVVTKTYEEDSIVLTGIPASCRKNE